VRYRAACLLRQLGPAARIAVPALIAARDDPDFLVRSAVARALQAITDSAENPSQLHSEQ
jgi:HEAT repeat protein